MKNTVRKRGRKFLRRFSRASVKASQEGKEHIKENLIERFSHIADIRLLIVEWSLLVGVLVMFAIAQAFWFGNSYADNVFGTGGTYTEATLGEVNSMNPLFATTDSERVLSRLMFATLAEIDYSGHPDIGLAESISSSEDKTVWTVKLREGLQWSDGEPITNDDVIFTTELIKNPAVNSIYDSNLLKVKVEENEKHEIVFTLPAAYADFISALNFPIVPKHVLAEVDPQTLIEHNFSNAPVTSGAFTYNAVQTTAAEGEKVFYLSANPNYYKGAGLLNGFAVHTYNDKDSIVASINAGAVTATAELSNAEAKRITSGQFKIKNSSLSSGAFIFFNTTRKAVKALEVRSAIRQGIDIDKIREIAADTIAIDYPLLESQIKLSAYPDLPERDFSAAKAALGDLITDETKHIDLATVNSGFLPMVAEELKTELEELGFEVNLTTYDENQEFINNIISKRSYDILVYEVELGADPDLTPYYHSSQANASGLNLSSYRSVLADDLLLGARNALDEELRVKKYESFLENWVADVPAIALYQPNLTYYYNKNTRTFSNDVRLVTALDRFSDVGSWAVSKETKNKTP